MEFEEKVKLISDIQNFFKEFAFNGITSFRFFNTLLIQSKQGKAKDYIINYFKLIDNPYIVDLIPKLDSLEFSYILKRLKTVDTPPVTINKRLIIYFGYQGTGKTTKAENMFKGAKVMNCNSGLEPSDLLECFDFENGQTVYKPTALFEAMQDGSKVILEEMNLLTNDCLRALQAYLDNKDTFDYKGKKIKIKEGFKVIGTMNLDVNGEIFRLPEPLVDRAEELIEFKPSCELLAKLSFGE